MRIITSWEQPTQSQNSTAVQSPAIGRGYSSTAPPTMTRFVTPMTADTLYDYVDTVIQSSKSFLSSSNAGISGST